MTGPTDSCNAIVKMGPKRYICNKATGHVRRGDAEHADGEIVWRDSPMGGETSRTF